MCAASSPISHHKSDICVANLVLAIMTLQEKVDHANDLQTGKTRQIWNPRTRKNIKSGMT